LKLRDLLGEGLVGLLVGLAQNQGDGWNFTLDAVSRYFDRVLEARLEWSADAEAKLIGGVYPERARQLGERTAELHLALASDTERPDFAPEPFSTLYQRSLYQAMRGSAGRVLRQLRCEIPALPESVRREAEQLAASQNLVLGHFASLLKRKLGAMKIRVHGDFHLGQVLNTGKDFIIIDFEGDPRRLLGERALKRSPLTDVAAMLRSFDYAASTALAREVETDAQRLTEWTRPWVEAACRSYLMGYLAVARGASFLPADPANGRLLLGAFLLDKAIFEIGHELSYRPDFLPIPLRAVLRMLEAPETGLEVWT
jgi:maltose alpha-D-glucosyltransferase/alpha-amylase